jgi:hypothetical protein
VDEGDSSSAVHNKLRSVDFVMAVPTRRVGRAQEIRSLRGKILTERSVRTNWGLNLAESSNSNLDLKI